MNPEPGANEADVLEQLRDLDENEEPTEPPTVDTEANPADVAEQSRPVPSEEEDWPET